MVDEPDDDGYRDIQWTDEAKNLLHGAATDLVAAVRDHAATLAGLRGGAAETPDTFAAHDALDEAARAYDDAVFELCGSTVGLGRAPAEDQEYDEDDEEQDWGTEVALLRRDDYALLDEDAVIAEGRAAYREVWPAETDADATAYIGELGMAMHEIMHARGPEALDTIPGLRPVRSTSVVVRIDDVGDSEDPDRLVDLHGRAVAGERVLLTRPGLPDVELVARGPVVIGGLRGQVAYDDAMLDGVDPDIRRRVRRGRDPVTTPPPSSAPAP